MKEVVECPCCDWKGSIVSDKQRERQKRTILKIHFSRYIGQYQCKTHLKKGKELFDKRWETNIYDKMYGKHRRTENLNNTNGGENGL